MTREREKCERRPFSCFGNRWNRRRRRAPDALRKIDAAFAKATSGVSSFDNDNNTIDPRTLNTYRNDVTTHHRP